MTRHDPTQPRLFRAPWIRAGLRSIFGVIFASALGCSTTAPASPPPQQRSAHTVATSPAKPAPPGGSSTNAPSKDTQEDLDQAVEGYVADGRRVGGPTDVERDLDTSFPKSDSLFRGRIPKEWFEWKTNLYEKHRIKLAISYQSTYQHASNSLTGTDHAWGGWLLAETKWEAVNAGEDYEGSLVAALDWRHTLSGTDPALLGPNIGSAWLTDIAYLEFGPTLGVFYWEQWFKKDRLVLRVGKQITSQIYDFFRFKDSRTSFTATPFTLATASIASPPPGQGISFELWPVENSEWYVIGTLNDMNGDPDRFGLDTFFNEHQYFYGFEVGTFKKRDGMRDFDHVHLNVFYSDPTKDPVPGTPNESGAGFKVLGEKQWRRIVGFASYTYNDAQGGGFSVTLARHAVTAGVALLKPAGIRGEAALGLAWIDPIDTALNDQFGGELYWKLLLTPDMWITPGVQVIIDPTFNPSEDFVVVGQFKFRLFF